MTSTPPEAPPTPPVGGPRVTREQLRDLDRLQRTTGSQKYVAGVAGGVARHLDIDPAIVRVLFVVLTFFGGAGLLLYGALWLLLPEDDGDQAMINLDKRSLGFVLVAVLVFAAVLLVGDSWGGYGFPWPLTIAGIVVAVVLLTRDRRASTSPGPAAARPRVRRSRRTPRSRRRTTRRPARRRTPTAYPDATATYPAGPAGGAAWTPPVRTPRPRDPRRRGPILFWFTLALIALAVGILGMVDVSGVDVPGSAYPALALGITGVMLVVGAFFGRAGGLILLGLLIAAGPGGRHRGRELRGRDGRRDAPDGGRRAATLRARRRRADPGPDPGVRHRGPRRRADHRRRRHRPHRDHRPERRRRRGERQSSAVRATCRSSATTRTASTAASSSTQDVRDEVASIRLDADLGVGEIVITTRARDFR